MKIFYKGKCIKAMSQGKTTKPSTNGILIAKYKFDCSLYNLFPEFNEGFEYTYIDEQTQERDVLTYDRETITIMNYDAEPDEYGILTTEYEVETPVLRNAGDIITRSIYAKELPTSITFGTTGETTERCSSLIEICYLNISNITNMTNMFRGCKNVISINSANWNTSKVTSMNSTFDNCQSLTSIDVSKWDTSNVKTMYCMFYNCIKLTQLDVSNFDTSNVTDMSGMFGGCELLTSLDVSNWDVSNITSMYKMFIACHELKSLDLSSWGMSLVEDTIGMFDDDNELKVVKLNNSHSKTINKIIARLPERPENDPGTLYVIGSNNLHNVKEDEAIAKYWNIIDKYKIAEYKFYKSIYDNLIPEFNSEFTDYEIVDEYLDTEDIVVTNTETMMIMNYDAEPDEYGVLTTEYEVENISTFSAENIVTRTIYSTELPTLIRFGKNVGHDREYSLIELMYAKVDELTTTLEMFANCINMVSCNTEGWNTSNVQYMGSMFYNCSSLTQLDVSNWDTSQVQYMDYMFYNCKSLTQLDVSNWDTSQVQYMDYMFSNCKSLTTLNLSNFDTSNVTNMFNMFGNCILLTKIEGLENFNTSKVTNMGQLFMYTALTELDLSRFDISKVTNIDYMFQFNNVLTKLNLSNWHIQPDVRVEVPFMEIMTFTIFTNCYELTNIIMNDSDCNSINKIISVLPTRTSDSKGTLDIVGIDDISQVDIATAQSKYWNVVS